MVNNTMNLTEYKSLCGDCEYFMVDFREDWCFKKSTPRYLHKIKSKDPQCEEFREIGEVVALINKKLHIGEPLNKKGS